MNYLDIELKDHNGDSHKLKDFKGEKIVLYFYPKDNTPGCSLEAKDFTCLKDEYNKLGYKIIGVSADSVESHAKFIDKQDLGILLLSDPEKEMINAFNTFGEKKNYGKIYMGLIRSTFILDEEGNIVKEYRNVRAKGHAERVLREIKESN